LEEIVSSDCSLNPDLYSPPYERALNIFLKLLTPETEADLFVPKPIPPFEVGESSALPFNKIIPTSGKNLPYEPELDVYPVEAIDVFTTPRDPDTSSYTLPESVKVTVDLVLLSSVKVNPAAEDPDRLRSKVSVPGRSFSLYLALSIEIT